MSVGIFTVIASGIIWSALKFTIGLRVDEDEELAGLDKTELGMEAYLTFRAANTPSASVSPRQEIARGLSFGLFNSGVTAGRKNKNGLIVEADLVDNLRRLRNAQWFHDGVSALSVPILRHGPKGPRRPYGILMTSA